MNTHITTVAQTFDDMPFLDSKRMKTGGNFWDTIKAHPKRVYSALGALAVTAGTVTLVSLKVPSVNQFMNSVGTHIRDFAETQEGTLSISGFAGGTIAVAIGGHQTVVALADTANAELNAITTFAHYVEIDPTGTQLQIKKNGPYDDQKALNIWGVLSPAGRLTYGQLLEHINTAYKHQPFGEHQDIRQIMQLELHKLLKQVQIRKLTAAGLLLPAAGALYGMASCAISSGFDPLEGLGLGVVPGVLLAGGSIFIGNKILQQQKKNISEIVDNLKQAGASVEGVNISNAPFENSSREVLLQDMQPMAQGGGYAYEAEMPQRPLPVHYNRFDEPLQMHGMQSIPHNRFNGVRQSRIEDYQEVFAPAGRF